MIINSSLPADSTPANLQNSRPTSTPAGLPTAGSTPAGTDTNTERMRELSVAGQDEDWASQDIGAADGWTSFLRSNIPGQGGTALAAQANQNPETVFSLLQ